jgi:diphthamide biosynthesis protein 4
MSYTKDYYAILSLPRPSPASTLSTAALRRAYKLALLAAHPDTSEAKGRGAGYTVDDVKEAFAVLCDDKKKVDYNNWFLHQGLGGIGGAGAIQANQPSTDFILGLELLDLSDFDVLDPEFAFTATQQDGEVEGGEDKQMEWTRACRCGKEQGFRIAEEELEEAERRGEKEVLVGCEGCSLWVRVGFGVEEG